MLHNKTFQYFARNSYQQKLILLLIQLSIILIETRLTKVTLPPMNQPNSFPHQNHNQSLILTFRKLMIKSPDLKCQKVTVVVKTFASPTLSHSHHQPTCLTHQISKPRIIKNGVACFYGESIILTERITTFTIQVFQLSHSLELQKQQKRVLVSIKVTGDQLQQIKKRKNTFSSGTQNIQLIWQARLHCESNQDNEQYYDRSLQDFDDLNVNQEDTPHQLFHRKIYSPAVRGESRERRLAPGTNSRKNKRLELVSQSPHKLTIETNETVMDIKKKLKLMSPLTKVIGSHGEKQFEREMKQCVIDKDQVELNEKKVKGDDLAKMKRKSFKQSIKSPMTPQGKSWGEQSGGRRKGESILEKINLKSLLYSSVIGIIGGVVSTQF